MATTRVQIHCTTVLIVVAVLLLVSEMYRKTTGPEPISKPTMNTTIRDIRAGALYANC